jgi:hypothetical protein
MAGRDFARFHIDVGFGDAVLGEPESLVGDDLLAFAGMAPARAWAITLPQQFAEKIHAYTFPWTDRENTRSRDLVDMVLLIERGGLDREAIRDAVLRTFGHRKRHDVPRELLPPPAAWALEYPAMAAEAGITATTTADAFDMLVRFWSELRLPLRHASP